jgi:hypothetical protein
MKTFGRIWESSGKEARRILSEDIRGSARTYLYEPLHSKVSSDVRLNIYFSSEYIMTLEVD